MFVFIFNTTFNNMNNNNNNKTDPLDFEWCHDDQSNRIEFAASFTDWQPQAAMWSSAAQRWVVRCSVPKGTHHFKWVVNGTWTVDDDQPQAQDDNGNTNNVLYFV